MILPIQRLQIEAVTARDAGGDGGVVSQSHFPSVQS